MFSARASKPASKPGLPPTRPPSKTAPRSKVIVPKPASAAGQPVATSPSGAYGSWKQAFETGVVHYKAGAYEQAVKAFDEATTLGGGRKLLVLDSRAATLEKLGRIKEAILDAKAMVELAPEAHKGYVRGSHLYTLLSPPQYTRAHALLQHGIPLAPAHLQASLTTRLDGLRASSQAQTTTASRRRLNWQSRLPDELLELVGLQATLADPDAALRMAGVCQRWREVVLYSPSLWFNLRLNHRRPKAKLAHFVSLANDRLDSVFVLPTAGDVVAAVAPHLGAVTSLHLTLPPAVKAHQTLETLYHRLHPALRYLHLESSPRTSSGLGEPDNDFAWEELMAVIQPGKESAPQSCPLESLSLVRGNIYLPFDGGEVQDMPRLRKLALSGVNCVMVTGQQIEGLRAILDKTPTLEELSITDGTFGWVATTPPEGDESSTVPPPLVLPHLKALIYSHSGVNGLENLMWSVPRLERLDVSHPHQTSAQSSLYTTILFPPSAPDLLPHLTHLNISRTLLDEIAIIANLRRLPSLVELQVGLCGVTNALVEALTLAPPESDSKDTCPKLEKLNISHSDGVTGGPILRLVSSRLTLVEPSDTVPERAVLRSLNIDACPNVEEKAVSWLRPRLSDFSARIPKQPKPGFVDRARRGY